MEILTAIIAIETFVIIVLTIILLRKRSSGIEPITADLFKEMLKKIPSAEISEEELIEKKADERIENIRKEMSEEIEAKISEIGRKSRRTDVQIKELQDSMEQILNKAITESRTVEKEVAAETLTNRVLVSILDLVMLLKKNMIEVAQLREYISRYQPASIYTLLEDLIHLRDAGYIDLPDNVKFSSDIRHSTPVVLTPKGFEKAREIESRICGVPGEPPPYAR